MTFEQLQNVVKSADLGRFVALDRSCLPPCCPIFETFLAPFLQIVYTPAEVWRPLTAENLGRFYAEFVV